MEPRTFIFSLCLLRPVKNQLTSLHELVYLEGDLQRLDGGAFRAHLHAVLIPKPGTSNAIQALILHGKIESATEVTLWKLRSHDDRSSQKLQEEAMEEDFTQAVENELRFLSDPDPQIRLRAVRALARIGRKTKHEQQKKIVTDLSKLAENKEAFIRWNVALALGQLGHESALPALARLAEDEHANVRFRVALALARIGDEKAIPVLEKLARDNYRIGDHLVVRAFAALALGHMGHRGGLTLLAELPGDSDPVVRWHVAVAMGEVGDPAAIPYLAKLTEDPIPFVRAHAAIALSQIGGLSGAPHVERLLHDEMPKVAKIAAQSLELLASRGAQS